MEIIKVDNIHKIYNSSTVAVNALKGVSLSVNKGEFLVIAGESGSGKTTLLNIIGTLDNPTEGGVMLEGQDISKKSKGELSDIRLNKLGFVFQAFNLIPVLTAMENIEFTMMLLGIPESVRHQRTLLIMEELGIAELADKKPNQMSGGQQQRVAVARAIVHNPLIVLADEPTANLDSKTGEHLLELMQKMNREKNITFVFSSHDNKVISKASRLITLKDGLILSGK
jgi:putative ABC transport system ATP-binding protein